MTISPSAAPPPTPALQTRAPGAALRLRDAAVLRLHRLVDRFEQLPPEFGAEGEIDETNANAVAAEWIRCLRLWAAYSPEQVFALEVGAALLAAAVIGLWICIGLMS
jgi:hypothetical protein